MIIIGGPPASGKTSLANELSNILGIPLISKDDIKIEIYEPCSGLVEDKAVSIGSYNTLFYIIRQLLNKETSFIVESNFDARESAEHFRNIMRENPCQSISIICTADIKLLHKRFVDRDLSSERHPHLVCTQYCFYYTMTAKINKQFKYLIKTLDHDWIAEITEKHGLL